MVSDVDANLDDRYLPVLVKGEQYYIRISQVLYFESSGRKITAVEENQRTVFYGRIGDLEKQLKDKSFFRCHQSYLVNLNQIADCAKQTFDMKDGTTVPISRNYWKEAQLAVQQAVQWEERTEGYLFFVTGGLSGQKFPIQPDETVSIGRDPNLCQIVLEEPHISRRHCTIRYDEKLGMYEVVNTSKNGIRVNGNVRLERSRQYMFASKTKLSLAGGVAEIILG